MTRVTFLGISGLRSWWRLMAVNSLKFLEQRTLGEIGLLGSMASGFSEVMVCRTQTILSAGKIGLKHSSAL